MGARRIRREQRRFDMALSRRENGMRKDDERQRRTARIKAMIGKGKFPYTPVIQSWLSQQLGKPTSRITEDDVKKLMAQS